MARKPDLPEKHIKKSTSLSLKPARPKKSKKKRITKLPSVPVLAESKTERLKREYTEYRQKLEKHQTKLMSKGYIVRALPKQPKRITEASLRKLKKHTKKTIEEQAEFYIEDTNKLMSYQKHQQLLKEQRKYNQKVQDEPVGDDISYPDFYDVIVQNFREQIQTYLPHEQTNMNANRLLVWLDGIISRYGIPDVANMIIKANDNGVIVTWEVVYSSDKAQQFMYDMLNYMEEAGQMERDTVNEIMEMLDFEEGESYTI